MEATRRDALGLAGAAAMAAIAARAGPAAAAPEIGSPVKTLFWTATITPCDKSLAFDPGALRDVLAWYRHNGADGVVVLGTTGEFPSFSLAERKRIAETALKDKLGLNVIVGPGTSNLPETIELARHAADHGADGLLVIPPFYYTKLETEPLTRYYSMLFDQVRIPINLYHIPGLSQIPISIELLRNLSHYPNLAGIKDSTGDPAGYAEFVRNFAALNMRTGTGNNLGYALDHGMGAILAEGNVFTRLCADVFTAYRDGKDYHAAIARMRGAEKMMREAGAGVDYYGPMKYAVSLEMGGPQTYQRPPNADVTDAQKAAIRETLAKIKDMA
ncbi:MAG TPA: dihydrodipicolinate synthase family protein [Caulobacteraceae bacterium]|nr:dihydrodipicolinate synthase family protein [Caulobacteraceae bacterium]